MFEVYLENVAYARRQEFLQQAEHWRLIKSLPHQTPNHHTITQQLSVWAGGLLVKWGLKLQTHYSRDLPGDMNYGRTELGF